MPEASRRLWRPGRPRGHRRQGPGHPGERRPPDLLPIPPDTEILVPAEFLFDPRKLLRMVRLQKKNQQRVGVPRVVANDSPSEDDRNLHPINGPPPRLLFQLHRHVALHQGKRLAVRLRSPHRAIVQLAGAADRLSRLLHHPGIPVSVEESLLPFCESVVHRYESIGAPIPGGLFDPHPSTLPASAPTPPTPAEPPLRNPSPLRPPRSSGTLVRTSGTWRGCSPKAGT